MLRAPVVFALKKDYILRFCVEYRRLNAMMIQDSYPIPPIDELLDSLGHAVVLSSLDYNWGYCKIPKHPDDIVKTTFTSPFGTFMYKRMHFGLQKRPHDISALSRYLLVVGEVEVRPLLRRRHDYDRMIQG